jgi:hypothetical protein
MPEVRQRKLTKRNADIINSDAIILNLIPKIDRER